MKEALIFLVLNHPKLNPNNVNSKYIVCPNYVKANDFCRKKGGLEWNHSSLHYNEIASEAKLFGR